MPSGTPSPLQALTPAPVPGAPAQCAPLWNRTEPFTAVAGLEVTREHAEQLLAPQPVCTFVCRVSLTEGGGLALSIKTASGCPQVRSARVPPLQV